MGGRVIAGAGHSAIGQRSRRPGPDHRLSALGQPLRAEVEIFATPDELAEMQAKLAAPDEFKRAGVDYSSTLLGISFAIDQKPPRPLGHQAALRSPDQ
ncbi:MAG: hypothetical protein V5B36_02615 [Candidatus Accumulibacter sp. UW25]